MSFGLNNNLSANNSPFRFGYNEETQEYGYILNVGGADTVIPFSNEDKLTDELYQSLQYSGLVTSSMTFDQMCKALLAKFPKLFYAYNAGTKNVSFSIVFKYDTVTYTEASKYLSLKATHTPYGCNGWVASDNIDFTPYETLSITYSYTAYRIAVAYGTAFSAGNDNMTFSTTTVTSGKATKNADTSGTNIVTTFDISSITGNRKVAFFAAANASTDSSITVSQILLS